MHSVSIFTGVVSVLTFASAMATHAKTKLSTCMNNFKFPLYGIVTNKAAAAQDYFDTAMAIGDSRFDANYGYLWYLDNGPWSIRFTAWYIPGLLYRNQGNDLANAEKALRKMLVNYLLPG